MRKHRVIALLTLAGSAAVLCTTLYAASASVRRWDQFYVWKLISGKFHGGRRIQVNGISVYYETFGAGPPVLVLHGGFGSLEGMSYQIRALAASHFVVAVDSRGHGRSTDGSAPLSYSLMSDDMVKVLDHLQIERADVVGWSDGAIIGLDLAMRHPDRVKRLVAISANYDVDGLTGGPFSIEEVPRMPLRYWLLAPNPAHWPVLYRKVVTMWQTQPHYTLSELGRIEAPTLVMAGEHDIIKRAHTDQLAKAIPGSQETIIDHSSHSVPTDQPELVNAAILKYLD